MLYYALLALQSTATQAWLSLFLLSLLLLSSSYACSRLFES